VGETIDQTRVEIAAQRAQIEATVAQIHEALDLKQRIRGNPGLVLGLAAGTLFLVVGGPKRLARAMRRRMSPTATESAFDALPSTLQAWVETLADAAGPRAGDVRRALVEELVAWRHHRVRDRKARAALARQLVEGPAGPGRTAWTALEAGLTILSAALARKAVERFLTAESGTRPSATEAAPSTPTVAGASPKSATASAASTAPPEANYSGFSTRGPRGTSAP
jgi:hypothetical protein